MEELIQDYKKQIEDGYKTGKDFDFEVRCNKIIFCGMGGSAIIGDYIAKLVKIPVFVNRSYEMPSFTDKDTLAIIVSYSGNTEETISAFDKIKCNYLIISSNGFLGKKKNCIKVPEGYLPRESLPYMLFACMAVLEKNKLLKINVDTVLKNIKNIGKETDNITDFLKNNTPCIYTTPEYSCLAYRWQTQLNENSKIIAHHNVFTELCHNEIEVKNLEQFRFLILLDESINPRVKKQIEFYTKFNKNSMVIKLKGKDYLSKLIYGTLIGDLVSYNLADFYKANYKETPNIKALKEFLKK